MKEFLKQIKDLANFTKFVKEVEELRQLSIIFKEHLDRLERRKEVHIAGLDDSVVLPEYKNLNDSGMDVRANEDVTVYPGEVVIVKTGLYVALGENTELQIRPRSGVSVKTKLRVANSPGTVDEGYRGEIGIIIENLSMPTTNERTLDEGTEKDGIYHIKKGDRIAQFVFADVLKPNIKETTVGHVKSLGLDRKGGFGSTGIKRV